MDTHQTAWHPGVFHPENKPGNVIFWGGFWAHPRDTCPAVTPPIQLLNLTQSHLGSSSHLLCMAFEEQEIRSYCLVKGIFILPL